MLEEVASRAGLEPAEAAYVEVVEEYPDLQTVLRGCLAAPPFRRAARAAGEEAVRDALAEALATFQTPGGRYRLPGELRCLIARAGSPNGWIATRLDDRRGGDRGSHYVFFVCDGQPAGLA